MTYSNIAIEIFLEALAGVLILADEAPVPMSEDDIFEMMEEGQKKLLSKLHETHPTEFLDAMHQVSQLTGVWLQVQERHKSVS